jgi:hypothetical protein
MSPETKKLFNKIQNLSLGDLCLLCGQAINMGMDKQRVDLILKQLEIAMLKRKLTAPQEEGEG